MIQRGTYLNVIDNSGARYVYCIKVYSRNNNRYGRLGDTILGSVKKLRSTRRSTSKVKKGEIVRGIIVRLKESDKTRSFGTLNYMKNGIVLINKQNKLIGTRILGTLPKRLRTTKFCKVLSVCSKFVL